MPIKQIQSGKANPQLLLCLALSIICTALASTLQAQEFKLPPLPPPMAAQGQGTPSNGYLTDPTAMLEVLRFEQMGIKDALTLRGAQAQAGLPFSISQQQIVSGARLDLHVQYTERLPSGTRLEVLLNGEQLSMIELISGTATDTVFDIPVNPLLLLPHNRLNLKLHAHAERCENPADSPLQVTVGKDSTVALGLQRLPLASDLSALPGPFFDEAQMGQLNLPVVMPANPSTTILRNAAIMASYFGSLASYRGTRFPVWLDELPMGHAVVFAQAGETIAGLTLPAIDGPGLSIIDNPRDPLAKLLLVTGRTPAELRTATLNLVLRPAPLSGSSMQVAPVMVTPRRPYDAPRWIPNDRPVRFAELAQEPLLSESTSSALMKLGFRAAPDAFLWDGSNIPMQIRYRFPDGEWLDAPQSHLDLTLNGRYLGSLPVLKAGVLEKIRNHFGYATRQEQARLEIPPYLIFGDNQLDLFFNIQHAPDPTCALKLPDRALSLIDGESVIDLSHTQHFAQLPNLSFFVGAGFPFTRLADLAETGVVLPDMPEPGEIEAMLGLLGRFGESTGYPAVNVEIVKGSAQLAPLYKRDLLVVGRLDGRLDLAPLLAGSDYRLEGQALRVAQPQPLKQLRTLLQGDWSRQESAADRQLSGTGRFQGLLSRRSPFDPTRVVVMALATQEDWLPRMVQTLRTPAINAEIRGDLTYFESTEKASSFRVGPLFAYGNLPWPIHIRWLFSERPLLLMSLLLVSTVLVAAGLYPLLRAHAAQRLG